MFIIQNFAYRKTDSSGVNDAACASEGITDVVFHSAHHAKSIFSVCE